MAYENDFVPIKLKISPISSQILSLAFYLWTKDIFLILVVSRNKYTSLKSVYIKMRVEPTTYIKLY